MTSTIFTEVDIQRLLDIFPPPEPQPGKTCLLRSLSGRSLVRSDAVIRRLDALITGAQDLIPLSSLSKELGVQEVQWVLDSNLGQDEVFFTADRRALLSRHRQNDIGKQLSTHFDKGGVFLVEFAKLYDITTSTLRRILTKNIAVSLTDLEDRCTYSDHYLQRTCEDVRRLLRTDEESVLEVNEKFPHLPTSWLENTCRELVADENNALQGVVGTERGKITFTPKSAMLRLQDQQKQARDAYIEEGVSALRERGYFDASMERQPKFLKIDEGEGVGELGDAVCSAYMGKDSSSKLVQVSSTGNTGVSKGSACFIVRHDVLDTRVEALATKSEQVAVELWMTRSADDVSFDSDIIARLIEKSDNPELDQALVDANRDPRVKNAFESKWVSLQDNAAQQFALVFRTMFLCPFRLYNLGVDSIKDTALQPRIAEFIRDWIRRELVLDVTAKVKEEKLVANKSASRDFSKFSESVQAAKSLEDISTAVTKFARKQKIEQPDVSTLADSKRVIIEQKLAAVKRMKRGSDLLQNLTWLLLAASRDGLYMSSGKDTSRMIKVFQADGEAASAARLVELRDIVKEGKETDQEKEEMRLMAQEACAKSDLP